MSSYPMIAIDKIYIPKSILREPQTDDPKYQQVRDSLEQHGQLQPILLRPDKDPEGNDVLALVDGRQRLSCLKDLGRTEVEYKIQDISEQEAWTIQLVANLQRVEGKKAEFAAHLARILETDSSKGRAQLALQLNVSPTWIDDMLSLNKLIAKAKTVLDDGNMSLVNAKCLSKLPPDEQEVQLPNAINMKAEQFVPMANTLAKQLREAAKTGAKKPEAKFEEKPAFRKIDEIKDALEKKAVVGSLVSEDTTPTEAFLLGVKFCVNLDPPTLEARRAQWEAHQAKTKKDAEDRKAALKKKAEEKKAADEKAKADALASNPVAGAFG